MARLKNGNLWLQHNTQQLTGPKTLSNIDKQFQFLDPNGEDRNVLLPTASSAGGLEFTITNTAAFYNLVVKNNADSVIFASVGPGAAAKFICNSIIWTAMVDTVWEGGLQWTTVSGTAYAISNYGYLLNASNEDTTLVLPEIAATGDIIGACDAYRKASTHLITVARNGNNIEGLSEDLFINTPGAGFELVFVDSEYGWKIVTEIGLLGLVSGSSSGTIQDLSSIISTSITSGDTTHAPSGDAVFDALALKVPTSRTINGFSLDADIVIPISGSGGGTGTGLFEVDLWGALMPVNTIVTDEFFELDENGAVMPKV